MENHHGEISVEEVLKSFWGAETHILGCRRLGELEKGS